MQTYKHLTGKHRAKNNQGNIQKLKGHKSGKKRNTQKQTLNRQIQNRAPNKTQNPL